MTRKKKLLKQKNISDILFGKTIKLERKNGEVFFVKVKGYGKIHSYLTIRRRKFSFPFVTSKDTRDFETFFSRKKTYTFEEVQEVFEKIMNDYDKRTYFLMHLKIIR